MEILGKECEGASLLALEKFEKLSNRTVAELNATTQPLDEWKMVGEFLFCVYTQDGEEMDRDAFFSRVSIEQCVMSFFTYQKSRVDSLDALRGEIEGPLAITEDSEPTP